jgi:hypothetical protein
MREIPTEMVDAITSPAYVEAIDAEAGNERGTYARHPSESR